MEAEILHVVDIGAVTRSGNERSRIHAWQKGYPVALCNRANRYRIIQGKRVDIFLPVDVPITCKGCKTGLEMVTRRMLGDLTAAELEEVIHFMANIRNHPKKVNAA